MLSPSDLPPASEVLPSQRKHRSPPPLTRKNSFSWLIAALKPYFSVYHPRTWLFLTILSLQILLIFLARSLPVSIHHRRQHNAAAASGNDTVSAAGSGVTSNSSAAVAAVTNTHADNKAIVEEQCSSGKVYVYDLPRTFNSELLENCDKLSPWGSRCDALSNDGFGRRAQGLDGIVPENLIQAWYWTDQFTVEVIFHNRILNHKCRTSDPESASAFYIPFYVGLAVDRYLWSNYSALERDSHCRTMLKWVQGQPYFKKSDGWDHFITMGRITWDFRRSKDQDWGSGCIYMPGMRNITRLLIEKNPWDYFDVGVPYPTGFHPRSVSDVVQWQDNVRNRKRTALFCFAGATRGKIKNDFRGILLNQCRNESDVCRVVDCKGSKCANGTSAILETFLDSDFCLQPRGDSFTRRSIFDCMVAGSIPVFFWRRTAYLNYDWFLPEAPESYSVFIHRDEVKNGKSIREVLEKYSKEDVERMREKVIEYIPRLVYAQKQEGLEGMKDAFDVAIEGVLRRMKEQQSFGYKWR